MIACRHTTFLGQVPVTRQSAPLYTGMNSIFSPYLGPANSMEAKRRSLKVMDDFIAAMVAGKDYQ